MTQQSNDTSGKLDEPHHETTLEFESEDELVNPKNPQSQPEQPRSNNPIAFARRLYSTYDPTFVTLLGTQYFNQGSKVLVALATQKLFKDTYSLEPSYNQYLSGVIMLPWSIKIIYGFLSDNVPIFGSRRRSYLYIGALMQIFAMSAMSSNVVPTAEVAAAMMFISNVSVAMSDVVLDSLMVVQSRIDPKHGSEDL